MAKILEKSCSCSKKKRQTENVSEALGQTFVVRWQGLTTTTLNGIFIVLKRKSDCNDIWFGLTDSKCNDGNESNHDSTDSTQTQTTITVQTDST